MPDDRVLARNWWQVALTVNHFTRLKNNPRDRVICKTKAISILLKPYLLQKEKNILSLSLSLSQFLRNAGKLITLTSNFCFVKTISILWPFIFPIFSKFFGFFSRKCFQVLCSGFFISTNFLVHWFRLFLRVYFWNLCFIFFLFLFRSFGSWENCRRNRLF